MKTKAPRLPKVTLKLVRETVKDYKPAQFSRPNDIAKFLQWLTQETVENFVCVHLDCKHQPIAYQVVSTGTLTASLIHPREVFKAAILNNAHSVVLAHNHPSGITDPSRSDDETTKDLQRAGSLLGIPVLDHLIMGNMPNQEPFSYRESKPFMFR